MAGRISWVIDFQGIDAQITKLRQLDSLLSSISRKAGGGGLGGGGINIAGAGGGTVILPSGGTGAAGGGAAAGAVAQAGADGARYNVYGKLAKARKDSLERQMKEADISEETREKIRQHNEKIRQHNEKRGPNIGQRADYSKLNLSDIYKQRAGEFRTGGGWGPYTGTRGLNGNAISDVLRNELKGLKNRLSGLMGMGGGITTGMSRKLESSIPWIADNFMRIGVVIAGILAPFYALHKAIQFLSKGMEHLGEVYQTSARTARPAAENVALKAAFGAVGLGGGEYEYQTAQSQFNPRARNVGIPGTQEVIAALRPAQYANIQQLTNMAKEFGIALERAKASAIQMENASAENQKLAMNGVILGLKWDAMIQQLSAALGPVIEKFQTLAAGLLDMINTILEFKIFILRNMGIISTNTPGNIRTPGMRGSSVNTSAWEKMGFVFPGPKQHDNVATIAKNTGEMVHILTTIATGMRQSIIKAGVWSIINSVSPIPSLP